MHALSAQTVVATTGVLFWYLLFITNTHITPRAYPIHHPIPCIILSLHVYLWMHKRQYNQLGQWSSS